MNQAGGETYTHPGMQPPTMAVLLGGLEKMKLENPKFNPAATVFDPQNPHALPPGFIWAYRVPATMDQTLIFGTRVHGVDCASAEDLTRAEMEGRAQIGKMLGGLRHAWPGNPVTLSALPSRIGIRETRHAKCLHQLTESEVLLRDRFDDAIANGTYQVDVHAQGGGGLTFRYLDGREVPIDGQHRHHEGRWRPVQTEDPTFYQIPCRSMVPVAFDNVLVAGRCFGAVRVQVNCNQMGEAAGVAAALALKGGCRLPEVAAKALRTELEAGGAAAVVWG